MTEVSRGRCLLVTEAEPAASGAPDWRRFRALAEHYLMSRYEVDCLVISEGLIGQVAVTQLRQLARGVAIAPFSEICESVRCLVERGAHDIVHVGSPILGHALRSVPGRSARIVDMLEMPAAAAARAGHRLAEDEEEALFAHADVVVAADRVGVDHARIHTETVVEAPFVRQADRLRRPPVKGGRFLAGLWVEKAASDIRAVNAFFEAVRSRGGGGAPNFAIAGPGAQGIRTPALPYPVTVMPEGIDERVFYRGLDILIAPDETGGATRLDIMSALEMGATPLVSTAALTGLLERWRLPHFGDLSSMTEFVFENGHKMREGGLLTELRARADWTWTSLSNKAAQDRARLNKVITRHLEAFKEEATP